MRRAKKRIYSKYYDVSVGLCGGENDRAILLSNCKMVGPMPMFFAHVLQLKSGL